MITKPTLEFEFSGIGSMVHLPVVQEKFKNAAMKTPMPEGLLRLGVIEAKGLPGKDWRLFGERLSDPYAEVQIGESDILRTSTHPRTVNPDWGESGWGDFPFYNPRQELSLEIWDHDPYRRTLLGRLAREQPSESTGNRSESNGSESNEIT